MGRGPLLNLAVRRVANSFTPNLVGGMSGFKKYYSFSYNYNLVSINGFGEYIKNKFKGVSSINSNDFIKAFKKAYEEAKLTTDPQGNLFKYIVAFYSDKNSYNAVAMKLTYTDYGAIFIDDITEKFPITTTQLWSFVMMFSQNGNSNHYSYRARTAVNSNALKQAISTLYAPFYYNVIDAMPDGMSEDFKKYLSPKLEEFFKQLKV